MPFHVFVIMPFGAKEGIDFDTVYNDLIKAALEPEGFQVFRADAYLKAGEIRLDMFQDLLLADLVVADLSIDNPNVWYELGVRHALRARGVVLIHSQRKYEVFDLYTDRKLCYHIKGASPDPDYLDKDRALLVEMAKNTLFSWRKEKTSPVYAMLPGLKEPDHKSLRVGRVCEERVLYDSWERRLEEARSQGLIGDMLLLADEAPSFVFKADALFRAGKALLKMCRFDFALEQLDKALDIDPENLEGLQNTGICLQRLAMDKKQGHSLEKARNYYRSILKKSYFSKDSETWALLGRIDKDAWIREWRKPGMTTQAMRHAATAEKAWLSKAIESYSKAYSYNPAHYYSGINALTLMHLYRHLTDDDRYNRDISLMTGAVRYAAECETRTEHIYWAKATIGDLEVLAENPDEVNKNYSQAIVENDRTKFDPDSTLRQLRLLRDVDFYPEVVDVGIDVLDRALQGLVTAEVNREPEKVFLFSGHMIDKPGRSEPRFPAGKEVAAAQMIAEVLAELGAGPNDLALTQGACGGDILFTEACIRLGVNVHWMQPFAEPDFILDSVVCSNESWRSRYYAARDAGGILIRTAPVSLGDLPKGLGPGYPYERCNRWLLYTALACGIDKVRFICLWNGGGGDGPGGTAHMYNEVKKRTGQVRWIDTRTL